MISALVSKMSIQKVDDFTPHLCKEQRVQSLMIEINRWLYLGEDHSVNSERTKTLIGVLRRVAEVLKENYFLQCVVSD